MACGAVGTNGVEVEEDSGTPCSPTSRRTGVPMMAAADLRNCSGLAPDRRRTGRTRRRAIAQRFAFASRRRYDTLARTLSCPSLSRATWTKVVSFSVSPGATSYM